MGATQQTPIILCALALVACGGSAPNDGGAALTAEDRDAIRAASASWVDRYNRNDWSALADTFTTSGTVMPPNGPVVQGREAIATWEAEYESGFRIALDIDEIEGVGGLAYVRGRSCVFIPDGSGDYAVDVGKFLEVRRRQADGQWLIAADAFNSDLPVGSDLQTECPFSAKPDAPD